MGRRRGSSDSNVLNIIGSDDAPAKLGFDLFTTDASGKPISESIETRTDPKKGLFEHVIQDFSFLTSVTNKPLFARNDGINLFFKSSGNLIAESDGKNLKYTIEVNSGGEIFRDSFDYQISKILADDDLGITAENLDNSLVNSLLKFSDLITDDELNDVSGGFSIPPTSRFGGVLPSFEGDLDLNNTRYPNIFPSSGPPPNSFEELKNNNVGYFLDFSIAEEDIGLPTTKELSTSFGTSNGEKLIGTPEADDIFGNGGEDNIEGLGGDDNLYGGNQADEISGGDDNDTLFGNEGANLLVGGDGDDTLYGGNQADNIFGGAGDDTIYNNSGDDFIDSGSGFDLIRLGGGNDIVILSTGAGYDTIENYQLGMTTLKGFDQSELDFVAKNGDTEIFKGSDQLAVIRWKLPAQLSGGSFVA